MGFLKFLKREPKGKAMHEKIVAKGFTLKKKYRNMSLNFVITLLMELSDIYNIPEKKIISKMYEPVRG